MDYHYVCRLENLSGALAAYVPQFVGFSCFDDGIIQGISSYPNDSFIAPNYTSLINYVDNVIGLICIPDTSPERELC